MTPTPIHWSAYVAAYLWAISTGQTETKARAAQARAARLHLPVDVIYRDDTLDRWLTVLDLDPDHPFIEVYLAHVKAQLST